MKTTITCLLFILAMSIAGVTRAQNGGITHSNSYTTITNFGYVNDHYNLRITNKTDCDLEYRLTFNGTHSFVLIPAHTAKDVKMFAPLDCSVKIQCKPTTNCNGGPDLGQVEAKCGEGPDIIPLPVKFLDFKILKSTRR